MMVMKSRIPLACGPTCGLGQMRCSHCKALSAERYTLDKAVPNSVTAFSVCFCRVEYYQPETGETVGG